METVECLCHNDTNILFYEKIFFAEEWNQHKKKQTNSNHSKRTQCQQNVAQVNELRFTFLVNETLLYVNYHSNTYKTPSFLSGHTSIYFLCVLLLPD